MCEQEALSSVDVLLAFAAFTYSMEQTCRPTLLPPASRRGQGAVLELRGLWHPCAVPAGGSGTGAEGHIVPNDLVLGAGCAYNISLWPALPFMSASLRMTKAVTNAVITPVAPGAAR